jgi:CRP/FNR family transcriptional regulator, cyclic AMP receptor protein
MFRRNEVVDHLRTVPLFAGCTGTELKILARHFQEVEVPAGEALCREGDDGNAFFVVLRGDAIVWRRKAGRSKPVATLGPGSFFGELALLDPAPRSASVTAETPLLAGSLDKRTFRAVLRDLPAISDRLLAVLARRVRESDRVIADDLGSAVSEVPVPRRPRPS